MPSQETVHRVPPGASSFAGLIARKSNTNFQRCYQCLCCGSGCPFVKAMDTVPSAVFRMAQLGMEEAVLGSSTIWICVGCHTCTVQCPMAIDIPAVMDAFRQTALERGVPCAQPEILAFHQEVVRSIENYGRVHKLEIMMRHKVRTLDLFSDMDVGLKMLAKRKLDLLPSRVGDISKVRALFKNRRQG
jgi:heterodisulfide reductase subunit C